METSNFIVCLSLLGVAGCAGAQPANRAVNDEAKWLRTELDRGATDAEEATDGEPVTYQGKFTVHVADSTTRGFAHNPQERSDLPDLALFTRVSGQVVQVGAADNALTMATEYPVRLKRGDTVEMRLVDRRTRSIHYAYDSRVQDDWHRVSGQDVPLAQFSFVFEGPGRYFFHRGYGLFFVDLRQLE